MRGDPGPCALQSMQSFFVGSIKPNEKRLHRLKRARPRVATHLLIFAVKMFWVWREPLDGEKCPSRSMSSQWYRRSLIKASSPIGLTFQVPLPLVCVKYTCPSRSTAMPEPGCAKAEFARASVTNVVMMIVAFVFMVVGWMLSFA